MSQDASFLRDPLAALQGGQRFTLASHPFGAEMSKAQIFAVTETFYLLVHILQAARRKGTSNISLIRHPVFLESRIALSATNSQISDIGEIFGIAPDLPSTCPTNIIPLSLLGISRFPSPSLVEHIGKKVFLILSLNRTVPSSIPLRPHLYHLRNRCDAICDQQKYP